MTRIDVYNYLPRAPRKPARVSLDSIAAKLAGIAKAMSKPANKPASATLMSGDLRLDPTRDTLADMNRRNREFWHGNR